MRLKTLGLISAICFVSASASFANTHLGTWKLDVAKSQLGKGTGRSNVVNYEREFPLKLKCLIDGVDAHGHPYHSAWDGDFDGKDYRVTGDMSSDMRSYTKVNENTLDYVSKKDGKVVGAGRIAVAADGNSRTVTGWSMTAKGKKVKSIALYHKTS